MRKVQGGILSLILTTLLLLLMSCDFSYINEVPLIPVQEDYLEKVYAIESPEASILASRPFYNPFQQVYNGSLDPGFILAAWGDLFFVHPLDGTYVDSGYSGTAASSQYYTFVNSGEWFDLTRKWDAMASLGGQGGGNATFAFYNGDYFVYNHDTGGAANTATSLNGSTGKALYDAFSGPFGFTEECFSLGIWVEQSYGYATDHYHLFEAEGRIYQGTISITNSATDYSGPSGTSTYGNESLAFADVAAAAGVSGEGEESFFNTGGTVHFQNYVYNSTGGFSVCRVRMEDPLIDDSSDYIMVFRGSSIERMIPAREKDIVVGTAGDYVVVRGADGNRGMGRYHFLDGKGLDRGNIVVYGTHVHYAGEGWLSGVQGVYFSATNLFVNYNPDNDPPYTMTFYFLPLTTLEEELS